MKYSLDQPKEFDFTPSLNIGLSEDQAKIRRKQGLTNKIKFPNNGNVFFILLKNIFCISNIFIVTSSYCYCYQNRSWISKRFI